MAKQLGRALLVKIGDGDSDSESFNNLCGLNSKSLTINNSGIDVTTPDCTKQNGQLWTENLAGLKSVSVSGDGCFEDETTETRANTVAMEADNVANFEIFVPGFGTYDGAFRIATLEFGGETEGGVTYSISLESTGEVEFTAEQ